MALGGARVIDRSDVAWVEFIVSSHALGGIVSISCPDVPLHPPAAAPPHPGGSRDARHSETQTKGQSGIRSDLYGTRGTYLRSYGSGLQLSCLSPLCIDAPHSTDCSRVCTETVQTGRRLSNHRGCTAEQQNNKPALTRASHSRTAAHVLRPPCGGSPQQANAKSTRVLDPHAGSFVERASDEGRVGHGHQRCNPRAVRLLPTSLKPTKSTQCPTCNVVHPALAPPHLSAPPT